MLVGKKCLRYIIPFSYHENFYELCNRVDQEVIWERSTIPENIESDIYTHIQTEFISDKASFIDEKKMGISWRRVDEKPFCKLKILKESIKDCIKELPPYIDIEVCDMGLFIFRNSFGFLWYEIDSRKRLDSEELVYFQNIFKELNRNGLSTLWQEVTDTTIPRIIYQKEVSNPNAKIPVKYFTPFSMGNWIADQLAFLNPQFLPKRKNAFETMVRNSMEAVKFEKISGSKEELQRFFEKKAIQCFVPDKALLFTYCTFGDKNTKDAKENCDDGREKLSYYLTNGYKSSYHIGKDVRLTMRKPFGNVIWNATQEGCSYLAWPETDNEGFFDGNFIDKIRNDYFLLYIKCLFQSYSLMLYAKKIQDSLSAIAKDYLVHDMKNETTILACEINLFLTKTMATSISHIHHQSQFYIYLKEQLNIHADVKSVTAGLEALGNIQNEQQRRDESARWSKEWNAAREKEDAEREREKREKASDERMESVMCLFSVLAISSAVLDTYEIVNKFIPANSIQDLSGNIWGITVYVVFVGITLIVGGIALYHSVIRFWTSHKNKKIETKELK